MSHLVERFLADFVDDPECANDDHKRTGDKDKNDKDYEDFDDCYISDVSYYEYFVTSLMYLIMKILLHL